MRTFARLLQSVVAGVLLVAVGQGVAATPAQSEVFWPQLPQGQVSWPQLPWTSAEPDGVQASAAALAEGIAGTVLWSRQPNTVVPIASITKVMTALVVVNAGDLERTITVPHESIAYCVRHDGSTAGLAPGEVLTARQLLYAMMLPSGCDATYALAEAFGPGQDGFITKMNDTARQMGLAGTHFTDPSGLPVPNDDSNSSTPADLVTLGLRAMSQPVFRDIVGTHSYHLPAGPGNREHHWHTTNLLLGDYPGAVGIKTGYTDAAGTCLLFQTVRAGIPLIGVVLHSSTHGAVAAKDDAERMLDWFYGPILSALPIG
ncbi:D-alanyl-D-alanine carboxypeptidase family protein [Nocardia sp. CS682]|uniref:D-alanyl-D-alanine carboxypeptidase family protein n=1 Tax=Nocardia sp. CS682 TaxID=1047172 RepID=UPI001F11226C|nr:serine hydrolase [Nocardia sp. CS682]